MSDKLCIDTNVFVSLARKKSSNLEVRFAKIPTESIFVPEIVRAELEFGCLKSARPEENLDKIRRMLQPFVLVPFAGKCVERYAEIRFELEQNGNSIGPMDLMIAATALAIGATMVTNNVREFNRVPRWIVEDWQ